MQETDSVLTDYESANLGSSELEAEPKSESNKSELPLGLAVLDDFEHHARNRSIEINDSLFMEFLKSFTTYQNNMNDLLFDDPKYDTYNTLVYADESLVDPEAIEFEDSVKNVGFYVSMSEGMIFLEKDPQFLENFSKYLSERMNTFRIQYSKEIQYPLAEDGGIIISSNELIQRMLFWEKFANEHKDFELPNYANDQFEMNLFYLMFGMDNTPIHDWSDSLKIRPELIETYKQIIESYPNSSAVEYLTEYLNYLDLKNFNYDISFNDYGREKFPEMYGNPDPKKSSLYCQSVFSDKTFEFLNRKDIPEHLHSIIFVCANDKISGIIFGPSPEGEHGLYFFKAELEKIVIEGNSISFEFVKGDLYGDQITMENYKEAYNLEGYGRSSNKIEMEGELIGNTLTLKCTSEFYECYDSEMVFHLIN